MDLGYFSFFKKIIGDPMKNSKFFLFQKSKCTHVSSINLKGKVSHSKNIVTAVIYFWEFPYGSPCTYNILTQNQKSMNFENKNITHVYFQLIMGYLTLGWREFWWYIWIIIQYQWILIPKSNSAHPHNNLAHPVVFP